MYVRLSANGPGNKSLGLLNRHWKTTYPFTGKSKAEFVGFKPAATDPTGGFSCPPPPILDLNSGSYGDH
jgi:hypothetical protein